MVLMLVTSCLDQGWLEPQGNRAGGGRRRVGSAQRTYWVARSQKWGELGVKTAKSQTTRAQTDLGDKQASPEISLFYFLF